MNIIRKLLKTNNARIINHIVKKLEPNLKNGKLCWMNRGLISHNENYAQCVNLIDNKEKFVKMLQEIKKCLRAYESKSAVCQIIEIDKQHSIIE